jgi:carbamoyltransferase
LGGRSILGDPRSPRMQAVMNLKIKHRGRVVPAVRAVRSCARRVADYFDMNVDRTCCWWRPSGNLDASR